MSRFYRDRIELHLRFLAQCVPAAQYSTFLADYRCVHQEIRNETIQERQRIDASQIANARLDGRAEGIRAAVEQMLGTELFKEAFGDE
jgi:hypothetical protein